MKGLVAIESFGETEIHLPAAGWNYLTLCGMDGDDPHRDVDQKTVPLPHNAKVTCKHCTRVYEHCKKFNDNQFAHLRKSTCQKHT